MKRGNFGDGDLCPVNPEQHGRMIMNAKKTGQWCPAQAHDKDGTPAFYQYDGKTPRSKR